MGYIENPKTKGSGIVCAIPQRGTCPNGCAHCFFQSGRSYLEPLEENLPNMPPDEVARGRVVRVNDGNDSNHDRDLVIRDTERYERRFFNTAIPDLGFPAPVVLTINPGEMTDRNFHKIESPPPDLMFVRFRANAWNWYMGAQAVSYYTGRGVPVVLTFMAYWGDEPSAKHGWCWRGWEHNYVWRKRTLNSYWAITTSAWREAMRRHEDNPLVSSCGKVEGERGATACRLCGNCLREYYAAMERMRG